MSTYQNAALLVIDMQRGFLEPSSPLFIDGAPASVPACAAVIAACREKGVLVISAKTKVRLLPALNIPEEQLSAAVQVIREACGEQGARR